VLGGLSVAVQRLDLNGLVPLHFADQPGDGKTAFHAHHFLLGDLYDLRVDQHKEFLLQFLPLVLFFVFAFGIFNDRQLQRNVHLRGGKTDARRIAHRLDHVVDQGLQVFIEFGHGFCLAPKDRFGQIYDLSQCHR
jgi:hypothetical protein